MKSITVLGSTGSIGVSTLDIISRHPDKYQVKALTANTNADDLLKQCIKHNPEYAVMVDEDAASKLEQLLKQQASEIKVLSGVDGLVEVAELEEDERAEFLEELGIEEPGLNRVIRAGYKLLGLQQYFTAGPKEVRSWTIPIGATAPQAAGVIHTDFEKGFIRAEVISYDDYVEHGGEQGAKDAGRWRLEGKDYQVADGDVVHFRFNV